MQVIAVVDRAEWNTALAPIPNAHVLQTWEWGEFKAQYGWTPTRLLFIENSTPRAAAQILRRPLPRTPFGILYLPKGPALDYDDLPLFERVLAHLEQCARSSRAIFCKIDPDVLITSPAASLLPRRKWRASPEQIQYRNTVTLDLTRGEDELLAAMKPKWRYNIRLAQKKGVGVGAGNGGDEGDLARFYEMYAETGARDGFLIRPFPYYRAVWGAFVRAGLAHLLFARVGDETIAGLILFTFARRAWYFYGASRNVHRDAMPNHLLQWEAIRWAQRAGCREYDLWGAPERLDESAPLYGVYKFKMGFGGEFVQRSGAYDFVVKRALYWLYAIARPWYLARLRRRHGAQLDAG